MFVDVINSIAPFTGNCNNGNQNKHGGTSSFAIHNMIYKIYIVAAYSPSVSSEREDNQPRANHFLSKNSCLEVQNEETEH